MNVSAIILAGGRGSRMESDTAKPLHKIEGKTLLDWTLDKLDCLTLEQRIVVVGHQAEEVINSTIGHEVDWVVQPCPIGNADALGYGLSKLENKIDTILVLQADDSAFYRPNSLMRFIKAHQSKSAVVSLLSVQKVDKTPRFRIAKDGDDYRGLIRLEEKKRGQDVVEFFTGCVCFDRKWLESRVGNISVSSEGEFSVPALFEMARKEGSKIIVYELANPKEWVGINTREELVKARMLAGSKEAVY
jgi:bifunctional UDP-N-acetylglucosamine pyrophosphorylase/glucosamine-1-phosphate N-acetyltransferase